MGVGWAHTTPAALALHIAHVLLMAQIPLLTETGTYSIYPYMLHFWLVRLILCTWLALKGALPPFDDYWCWASTTLIQPLFILLYGTAPFRFCFHWLLEPVWLYWPMVLKVRSTPDQYRIGSDQIPTSEGLD